MYYAQLNELEILEMHDEEKRDEIIILRLTKTEKNRIYEKMFQHGHPQP